MESPSNLRFPCPEHASKPGGFKDEPPERFVNKFVKLGFPCKHPVTGKDSIEHMWVKVLETYMNTDQLIGELNNDPVMNFDGIPVYEGKPPKCGDHFTFTVDEIEDVLEESV